MDLGEFEGVSPTVVAAYLDALGEWKRRGGYSLMLLRNLDKDELSELEAMAFERWAFETNSEFDDSLWQDAALLKKHYDKRRNLTL